MTSNGWLNLVLMILHPKSCHLRPSWVWKRLEKICWRRQARWTESASMSLSPPPVNAISIVKGFSVEPMGHATGVISPSWMQANPRLFALLTSDNVQSTSLQTDSKLKMDVSWCQVNIFRGHLFNLWNPFLSWQPPRIEGQCGWSFPQTRKHSQNIIAIQCHENMMNWWTNFSNNLRSGVCMLQPYGGEEGCGVSAVCNPRGVLQASFLHGWRTDFGVRSRVWGIFGSIKTWTRLDHQSLQNRSTTFWPRRSQGPYLLDCLQTPEGILEVQHQFGTGAGRPGIAVCQYGINVLVDETACVQFDRFPRPMTAFKSILFHSGFENINRCLYPWGYLGLMGNEPRPTMWCMGNQAISTSLG